MFSKTLLLISSLLAAQGVFAAPAPDAHLSKRAEGVHLMNCRPFGAEGAPPPVSLVVYCPNDSDCNNITFQPSSDNVCQMSSGNYYTWEGGSKSCTFPTGVTFTWDIESNAQSQANYAYVGSGSNGFRSFAGYKDDQHTALQYNYHDCDSIYYFI